jgi:hypothetical protein
VCSGACPGWEQLCSPGELTFHVSLSLKNSIKNSPVHELYCFCHRKLTGDRHQGTQRIGDCPTRRRNFQKKWPSRYVFLCRNAPTCAYNPQLSSTTQLNISSTTHFEIACQPNNGRPHEKDFRKI